MRITLLMWQAIICLFVSLSVTPAHAQLVSDYIELAPRPDWIVPVSIPDFDAADDEGREKIYPLIDYQNRYSVTEDVYSSRFIVDLLTPSAVEDEGTLSIDFDPDYESITLHTIQIFRGDTVLDAMDLSEAMVFRTETDRSQMIFNGTLTFSLPVLGLRVGDRLEIAYTRRGRNPALGKGVFARSSFASTSEVKRYFRRLSFGPGVEIEIKTFNNPPEPNRMNNKGWTVFEWDAPDPIAPDYNTDVPDWAYIRPTYEISNFSNWSNVGDLFVDYYAVSDSDRAATASIVETIKRGHDTPKARAKAALDWVQTNIRYVGLELGEGGFIPRRPERVLKRRFGDCKDVTLLLLTLLEGLEVSADPILVNLDERGGEFKGLAQPYAFDHIKVLIDIDGSLFPADPTRDPQLGTLDTMEKGDIEFGLRLSDTGSVVTRLPQSDYDVRELITEEFDLVTEPGVVLYSLAFREYGEDADSTLAWIARDGETSVQESFIRYLADIYPTLEAVGEMEWESNVEDAWTELRMQFRLPGFTSTDRRSLKTRAYQLLAATPDFEGGTRDAPFSIKHPRNIRQVRSYIADDRYSFDEGGRTVETEAFRFSYKDTIDDNVYREDYRWISKQDHIKAEDFQNDMEKIDKLQDWSYTTINLAFDDNASANKDSVSLWQNILGWLFLIILPLAFGYLVWRSKSGSQETMLST